VPYGAFLHRKGFVSLDIKFMNILPTPCQDVPIDNILRLKRKRRDELISQPLKIGMK
jgi:hypothetical protein